MTIKFLTPYGIYPHNAIVTLDAATETALVAQGVASTTTTGGTVWAAPAADPVSGLNGAQVAGISSSVVRPDGSPVSGGVLGLIATRGACMSAFYAPSKQTMSKSAHIATEDIKSLQVVYGNWYVAPNSGESATGATATFSASIEYPAGSLTPVNFGGVSAGACASGENIVSDVVSVVIPRGSIFWVRSFQDNTAGVAYANNYTSVEFGEWVVAGVTAPNLTNSITNNPSGAQTNIGYRPLAIIGARTRDAFGILGDSRLGNGTPYDARPNSAGAIGEAERSLAKLGATANYGCAGERAVNASATQANRRIALIATYCSRFVSNYGINDCIANTPASLIAAALVTLANKVGRPAYQLTLSPMSASTDSWTTTGNQTTNATANPIRVALNTLIRNGLGSPFIAAIETADQVESARDSGIWKVTGSANGYTADGLHGNAAGMSLIEASPAFVQSTRL